MTARLLTLIAAALLAACGGGPQADPGASPSPPEGAVRAAAPRDELVYDVTLSQDRARLDVTLSFPQQHPKQLRLGDDAGWPAIGVVTREDGTELPRSAERVDVPRLRRDERLRYSVDMDTLAAAGRGRFGALPDAQVSSVGTWLLRPSRGGTIGPARLTLKLPEGVFACAPWSRTGDGSYHLAPNTFGWRGLLVLSNTPPRSIDIPGGTIELALLAPVPGPTAAGLERWLGDAGRAVSELYGGLPTARIQAIVHPSAGDGAVVFGETFRGGGPAVRLFLGQDTTDDELWGEWVAVHELTHLGLPPMPRTDAWLYEGLATYYQEVLRGRAGMLTPDEAWQRIGAGFGRGRRQGSTGRTLAEESREMRRYHRYMRVYWSGAAIALLWDVALRSRAHDSRTHDPRSLDLALREVSRRFPPGGAEVPAANVIAHLDAWLGEPLFSRIAERHLASVDFPDLTDAYEALGVDERTGRPRTGRPREAGIGLATEIVPKSE